MNESANDLPVYRVHVVEKAEQNRPETIQCRIGENVNFDLKALASYCSTRVCGS